MLFPSLRSGGFSTHIGVVSFDLYNNDKPQQNMNFQPGDVVTVTGVVTRDDNSTMCVVPIWSGTNAKKVGYIGKGEHGQLYVETGEGFARVVGVRQRFLLLQNGMKKFEVHPSGVETATKEQYVKQETDRFVDVMQHIDTSVLFGELARRNLDLAQKTLPAAEKTANENK